MITVMRLVLAASALLIIYIDPAEPDRYAAPTYTVFVLYVAYSIALYALLSYRRSLLLPRIDHWLDVGWYLVLISLSSGTNSVFFFFFFFAILVASFRWGLRSGVSVTLVCAILFTIMGIAVGPPSLDFELNRFLLRPVYLLVLGYMMAYWGGSEITLKRRLALLKDVSTLSNPRFGVDRTIGSIMERLRAFYDADACLLVTGDHRTGQYSLRRAARNDPEEAMRAEPITEGLVNLLLALPAEQAVAYSGKLGRWCRWRPQRALSSYDATTGERMANVIQVSGALEAESLITVPFRERTDTAGRLYLTTARRGAFDARDVDFMLQVLEQTLPVIDNIRLVDRLATDAADTERQRIALDLHDSVIQPYIGLQMGLAAIAKTLSQGTGDVRGDVARLLELTNAGVAGLREVMRSLKDEAHTAGSLLLAVQRFTAKFTEATGIAVDVTAEGDVHVNDRLAAEVFQMIAEGLSNVRRHTSAQHAAISLECRGGQFLLRIENDNVVGTTMIPFTPRSIMERVTALGGNVHVDWTNNGNTVVVVDIPL